MGNGSAKIAGAVQSNLKNTREKKKKKVESEFRFLPTIREIRPIKRGGIYPSRACLRYIGFCESINLAYVTSMLILMQRDCNAVFQHKTENILDSFDRFIEGY